MTPEQQKQDLLKFDKHFKETHGAILYMTRESYNKLNEVYPVFFKNQTVEIIDIN